MEEAFLLILGIYQQGQLQILNISRVGFACRAVRLFGWLCFSYM